MPFVIRPYLPADQTIITSILRAIWADDEGAIQYFGAAEDFTGQTAFRRTVVAEASSQEGARILGFGMVGVSSYHPSFAYLKIIIDPSHQRRGIGSALYTHLVKLLEAQISLPIKTATYEHQEHALAFLQHRGFHEWMRTYLPVLELARFDPLPLTESRARVAARGYHICSMTDLAEDPRRNEKLADVHYQIYASIHPDNPPSAALYEQRFQAFLGDNVLPEAMYVALRGADYVAVASLRTSYQPTTLEQGLFGALPAYQADGLDLMLALIFLEIEYAKKQHIQRIAAEIDDVDTLGMALLKRLPFQSGLAWVTLVKG
jgi:GNAT superfamily N-acetyltransferase